MTYCDEMKKMALKLLLHFSPGSEHMYHFTKLAIELNEKEDGVAPTDSRNRPDQRYMEDGNWDDANKTKVLLEEKQRAKRKKMEAEVEEAMKKGIIVLFGYCKGAPYECVIRTGLLKT